MSKKRITIYDLAKELNISAATVSRALADDPRVKSKTKNAIQKLARQWNYHPNQIASGLRKGKSKIIGVLIPTSNSSIFFSVIYGIEEVVNKAGYNVLIGQSHESFEKEISSLDTFIRARIDGVIVSIAKGTLSFEHFENLLEHDIPVVFFDRVTDQLKASTVEINDYEASISAVEHLLDQGYRRIAHFAGPLHVRIYRNRLEGYKAAHHKHGVSVDEDLIMPSDITLKEGRILTKKLLSLPNPPDAIFSASDDAAVGAIQVLQAEGLRIPQDFGIMGFANKKFTSFITPSLTSIDQRTEDMGRKAAEILLQELQLRKENRHPQKIILDGSLICRSSSQRKGPNKIKGENLVDERLDKLL